MWRFFYNVVLLVLSPLIVAVLLSKPRCRPGLLQRLGLQEGSSGWSGLFRLFGYVGQDKPNKPDELNKPDKPDRPVIWIHAVSLGEVVADRKSVV